MEMTISKPVHEHAPHIPEEWDFRGRKIAIVGYSHYHDEDSTGFTQNLLQHISRGKRLSFFTSIAGYFESTNEEFWPHVAFLNFVPARIGSKINMRALADPEAHARGRERMELFMESTAVDRVMVFSTKAWNHFPHSDEERQGKRCPNLFTPPESFRYRAEIGTYTRAGRTILALGLRHPERSEKRAMQKAVTEFLSR